MSVRHPTLAVVIWCLVVAEATLVRAALRPGRRREVRAFASASRSFSRDWSWPRRRASDTGEPVHLLRFRTALERGASVVQAFEAASNGLGRWPSGARRLVRRVQAGASLNAALDQWVSEDRDPSVVVLRDALAISSTTGGSHLRAVDAVIDAVRERSALQREVRALASQARASALVLLVMPVGFAVVVGLLDPRVRAFSVGSPFGLACIAAGLALDGAGAWIMARMIRRVA